MADWRCEPSPDYGGEKQQHVADLLPFLLPAKSLTINNVTDVADFPDLCIYKVASGECIVMNENS
jgi:hypothetical protein